MSAPRDWVFPRCPECGARCGSTASRCWMCRAPLPDAPRLRSTSGTTVSATGPHGKRSGEKVFVATRAQTPRRRSTSSQRVGEDAPLRIGILIGLNAALGIVGIGLWTRAPGLAVLYVLLVAPTVTALYVSFDRQSETDNLGKVGQIIDRGLSILAKTFAILSLLGAACFFALFLFCSIAFFSAASRH